MKTRIILAALAAIAISFAVESTASAQSSQMSQYVWYVKRQNTQFTTGNTYTVTYGPYYSYTEALAKKSQLESGPSTSFTTGYGKPYIVKR